MQNLTTVEILFHQKINQIQPPRSVRLDGITKKCNLAIVVMAFERTHSLQRLLNSLNDASYPYNDVELIITIGKKIDNFDVLKIANNFDWNWGQKSVDYLTDFSSISEHYAYVLGLCHKLENIVVLEDDLFVSPNFYYFALQMITMTEDETKVAGISLNEVWFNGYTKYPFQPLKDENENYFMQLPFFHGQVFSKSMVQKYFDWSATLSDAEKKPSNKDLIHEMMISLSTNDDEWFPSFTKYLIDTDQYFVYPYKSLATNFGDKGKHFTKSTNFFQTSLELTKKEFSYTKFNASIAIYDSFHELIPSCLGKVIGNKLSDIDVSQVILDLNGTKSLRVLNNKYVITIRETKDPILSFGGEMKPMIQNIISNISGSTISLTTPENLIFSKRAENKLRFLRYDYHNIDSYQPSTFEFLSRKIRKFFKFF